MKCFSCDGGLESWEQTDSPWGEHCKWFEDCAFVIMKKDSEDREKSRRIQEFDENIIEKNILKKTDITVEVKTLEMKKPISLIQTSTNKLEDLQKEVTSLKEARNCKICMEKEASIIFLPCGHLCSRTSGYT